MPSENPNRNGIIDFFRNFSITKKGEAYLKTIPSGDTMGTHNGLPEMFGLTNNGTVPISQGSIGSSAYTSTITYNQRHTNETPSSPAPQSDKSTITPKGVETKTTPSSTSAGSDTQQNIGVPDVDFFKMLNLKEFIPYQSETNEDNYGAFMPIIIKNS